MEITTRELPPSIGINAVQKGVYEFDMDVVHLGVRGYTGEFAIASTDIQTDKQYLYLRAGQERYPGHIRNHDVHSFILGKFTRMWVDDSTIKGHVVIPSSHHKLFDAIVDAVAGTLNVGVCSMIRSNVPHGERHCVIEELWGAQVLTADGHNLCEMYGDSYSPLYEIMLKVAVGTRDYIGFCASSIASEPYVKQEQPAPPCAIEEDVLLEVDDVPSLPESAEERAEPYVACQDVVLADVHVKGLDSAVAKLAAETDEEKPYGKMFLTDPKRPTEEDPKDGA